MTEALAIITGVFQFWNQVVWLVKLLQGTPEADREKLVAQMQSEAEKLAQTGRPSWD